MRQVALISQTLRAGHCHSYLSAHGGDNLILTSDPSAFETMSSEVPVSVLAVTPLAQLLPRAGLTRTRLFRTALAWARSGSRVGRWLEHNIKRVSRRIRSYRTEAVAGDPGPNLDRNQLRASEIYLVLREQHHHSPIDRLVVFDLFDLPVALTFAEDHNIEVLVR